MKKLLWIFIILTFILFVPLIPHENEMQEGVTRVEYRSLFETVKERYEKIQKRVGVVPSKMPEVQREGVDSKDEHVQ